MVDKVTVDTFRSMKGHNPIAMLTAYDFGLANIMDIVKIDGILVGDSFGMVVQGDETTQKVTIEDMIRCTQSVSKGSTRALIVGDMPFGTFGVSKEDAIKNAIRLVQEGNAEAVKLEGASKQRQSEIEGILDVGIPVQGHIGLLPQSILKLGGYKVQGRKESLYSADDLIEQAKKLESSGCFSIILEAIPPTVAERITNSIKIPTIGIGAGSKCDGQILVGYDMLGYLSTPIPKFVKKYVDLREIIQKAVKKYISEVKQHEFPGEEFSYEE